MNAGLRRLTLLLLLFMTAACATHRPSLQDPAALPEALRPSDRVPDHFTSRAVLTLPAQLSPGGSLALTALVSRDQGLLLAALSPMGTPLFEMAATPSSVELRETETGKRRKSPSLERLTRTILGVALDMETLRFLLAGEAALPPWTSVTAEDSRTFLLHEGWLDRTRVLLDETGAIQRVERLHRKKSLYTLTLLSHAPPVWRIENGEHTLRLRIRQVTPIDPPSAERFRLH